MDTEFYGSQFDFSKYQNANLDDFQVYEIQDFNWNQISEITSKWVRAGQKFDVSEQQEQNQVEAYVALLRDILGFNYVPKCPLVVLIALFGISGGEEVSELRHPSLARYYEFLLAKHIFATLPSRWIELAYPLFGFLAHKFYLNEEDRLEASQIQTSLQEFSEFGDFPIEIIKDVFSSAVSGGVISISSEGYKFRHNYAFYYFLTKYWTERLSDEDIDDLVAGLSDNLRSKRSASILVFLAYQNRYECIIKLLQRQLSETLSNEVEFDFSNEQAVKLTTLVEDSPKLLLEGSEKEKQVVIEAEEERDKHLNQLEPTKSESEDDLEEFMHILIVTIRRIEL